jgi:hypothetical protein
MISAYNSLCMELLSCHHAQQLFLAQRKHQLPK